VNINTQSIDDLASLYLEYEMWRKY